MAVRLNRLDSVSDLDRMRPACQRAWLQRASAYSAVSVNLLTLASVDKRTSTDASGSARDEGV